MKKLKDDHYKLNFSWTDEDIAFWNAKIKELQRYVGIRNVENNSYECSVRTTNETLFYYRDKDEEKAVRRRDLFILENKLSDKHKLNLEWTEEDIALWKEILKPTPVDPKNLKYKGVYKKKNRWVSKIIENGQTIFNKTHEDQETIARTRDLFILENNLKNKYKLNFEWSEVDIAFWKEKINPTSIDPNDVKYIGVCKRDNFWRAQVLQNDKPIFNKRYNDKETAARARDLFILDNKLPTDKYKLNFTWSDADIATWRGKI